MSLSGAREKLRNVLFERLPCTYETADLIIDALVPLIRAGVKKNEG